MHESYYRPDTGATSQEKTAGAWTLLSGTPATCAAIGIHHICKEKPDLLISGPNFGRNTSSIAALASGTIGAALEGAGAGVRGIAVSYAFWSKETNNKAWVDAATRMTVKLAQYLYDHWEDGIDLYTINIPLCDDLAQGKCKVYRTKIHQAQHSCLFQPTNAKTLSEEELRNDESLNQSSRVKNREESPRTYEFRPRFEDLSRTVDSEEGRLTDTWAIAQKSISVTALRANFQHVDFSLHEREIKL